VRSFLFALKPKPDHYKTIDLVVERRSETDPGQVREKQSGGEAVNLPNWTFVRRMATQRHRMTTRAARS